MRDLPINGAVPWSSFQCQLDGTTYGLEFRWNERAAGWFMSIYDSSGNRLLANRRLVIGWGIIARFKKWNRALPPGDFIAVDSTNRGQEAGLSDLGTRVKVIYVEAADLAGATP
jgi:hypothetical protein